MVNYPSELINFYNQNKNYTSTHHTTFQKAQQDLDCAYYPIQFNFNAELLLKECQNVDDLYYNHRNQDKKNGYGHNGWQSLTLHGIDKHKTEHYTKYGFTSLEEAEYHWTDACERVPNLHKFLSELPFKVFDRVRIMRLAPGGYIMPHTDGAGRIFSPLNIAINNPKECYFIFKDRGIMPFKAGIGLVIDVGREHAVINFSNEVRYHIIVHGHYDKGFYNL
jgi:hypothetical protein